MGERTTVERNEIKKLSYIVNNFYSLELPERMTPKDKIKQHKLLRRYLAKAGRGRLTCKYYQKTPGFGRFYSKLSQQGMMREIRHTIAGKLYHDLDMVNAQPTLLEQYCIKNGIWCSFLSAYVEDRDNKIREIMEATGMSRDDVKRDIIIFMNGGRCFANIDPCERLPDWVYAFQHEMENIREAVFERETEIAKMGTKRAEEKRAKGEWANPKGSTTALLLQDLENNMLMAMHGFLVELGVLTAEKSECVYASDGMQVLREPLQNHDLEEVLRGMEAAALKKTGYRVEMKEKPMDQVIPLPEKLDEAEKITIITDAENEASLLFLEQVEDDLRKCQGVVFVRQYGIWTSDIRVVDDFLIDRCLAMNFVKVNDKGKILNYSSTVGGATSIIRATKARLRDNPDFIRELSDSNRGKIVFEDGYYDFDLGCFVEGFEGVHSTIQINRPFPKFRDNKLIAEIDKRILDAVLGNKKVPFMQFLARAVAGRTDDKAWAVILGLRNSGKGVLAALLVSCIESYVTTICPDSLLCQRLSFGGDEAKRYSWCAAMEFTRLTLTNEIKLDEKNGVKIDGNAIKRLSGGSSDKIMVRANYQEAREMTIQSTLLMCCNDMPEIAPKDATETLVAFECPHKFTTDVDMIRNNPGYLMADPSIKAFAARQDVGDAFFHLITDYYRDEPVTLTDDMKSFREDFNSGDDEMKTIDKHFEVDKKDEDAFVSNREIDEFLKANGVNMRSVKFGTIFVKKGAVRDKNKKGVRGLKYVRRIVVSNQEEDDES